MKTGTKSVLFGAHCFFIHPWFVAAAWWKLYGFPRDPRLWIAFFVHDLGYLGKPNMDGVEGETHIELGARIMRWFDRGIPDYEYYEWNHNISGAWWKTARAKRKFKLLRDEGWRIVHSIDYLTILERPLPRRWEYLSRYHSRFAAKKDRVIPSQLCAADKLSICLEPWWLYLPRVRLSGEIREYMHLAETRAADAEAQGKYAVKISTASQREWFNGVRIYLRRWVEQHKDGGEDTWTPDQKEAINKEGVWK